MAYTYSPNSLLLVDDNETVAGVGFIAGEFIVAGADLDFQWSSSDTLIGGFALGLVVAEGDAPEPEPEPEPVDPCVEIAPEKPEVCLVPCGTPARVQVITDCFALPSCPPGSASWDGGSTVWDSGEACWTEDEQIGIG